MINSREKTTKLTKLSNDIVYLPVGGTYQLGGKSFSPSNLLLNRTIVGLGGLDSGSIAASTLYYVYVVQSGGIAYLIASTSEIAPTGYANYRKVGAFYTDTTGLVFKVFVVGEVNPTVMSAIIESTGVISFQSPSNFMSSPVLKGGTANQSGTIAFLPGIFSIIPSPVFTGYAGTVSTCEITGLNITNIGYRTWNQATSVANAVNLVLQKNGIDAVQPDWNQY